VLVMSFAPGQVRPAALHWFSGGLCPPEAADGASARAAVGKYLLGARYAQHRNLVYGDPLSG
jgi:hypothetical protein